LLTPDHTEWTNMAADMSGEQMQAKIAAARREAETLKDKIRRLKEELGDTTRTDPFQSQ
jgi:guanine nucleotide-binding protein G(I)/G(S)/G(T) subunit beta-1